MAGRCMHPLKEISKNKIKELKKLQQKKYRKESNKFIVEGEKALSEIIEAGIEIYEIYSTKELKTYNKEVTYISPEDMKKLASTASACEVITIAKIKEYKTDDLKDKKKLILLEEMSDPGNLGTIIRSAAAFGAEGIILYGECVELYSPKVIRSASGNFFKIPVAEIKKGEDISKIFPNHTLISTCLHKESNITPEESSKFNKSILMFGSEANGLSKDLVNKAKHNIKLKMGNDVESINLAVSVSILLYETAKKQ